MFSQLFYYSLYFAMKKMFLFGFIFVSLLFVHPVQAKVNKSHRPLRWPIQSREILVPFQFKKQFHLKNFNISIGGELGDPIYAARGGTVVGVGCPDSSHDCNVIIDHGTKYKTIYEHLRNFSVQRGDHVRGGDQIGTLGKNPFGLPGHQPYLGFFVYKSTESGYRVVNPIKHLKK